MSTLFLDLLRTAARHEARGDFASALDSLEQALDDAPMEIWRLIGFDIARVQALELEQRAGRLGFFGKTRRMLTGRVA